MENLIKNIYQIKKIKERIEKGEDVFERGYKIKKIK